VTDSELMALVEHYRAGLDAEIALLRRLQALSLQQRQAMQDAQFARLSDIVDERDGVMATLVTIEHDLKITRRHLLEARDRLDGSPEFTEVVALHRTAAGIVAEILAIDRHSLDALKEAEVTRRLAAQALEQGESTLAAYRRVVKPSPKPSLLDRRG
jgi:hypothetical protein